MLNLDKLVFEVDTKQLDDALVAIGALEKGLSRLTSNTEDNTKTAIENERLQKELVKAQKERIRAEESLERAIKKKNDAEQKAAEVLERKGKADEESNEKLSASEKIIQRAEIRYKAYRDSVVDAADSQIVFSNGLIASQANTVATLKLLGATTEQMQRYADIVANVNAQAPVNLFDKSTDGLNKLNKEIKDLSSVNEYLAKGFNITRDQIQGMNRDIERFVQRMKEIDSSQIDIDTGVERIKKETISAAEQLNTMKAQAAEATKLAKLQAEAQANVAKQQRESAQELFNIHQMKLNQDEANYQKEQALLREHLLAEDRLHKEREQSLKSAFDRQVQIHNWKQEQDRKNYDEDMRAMREYYSDIVKQQEIAEKAINDSQRALLREQGVAKYSGMGYSSRISNKATDLELQGVSPQVIKSYLDQASANEKATRALRDKLTAQRAVEAAEEKMEATLSHFNDELRLNASLNERAALALGTYERNLVKAGYASDVVAQKVQKRKEQEQQLAALEAKRQGDYVARGVGVQMGDVAVSLAGGMNPLLVMIQQGDQIRGLIQQAGQDGVDLKNVMNDAAVQIARSFKDVGAAVGNFIGGAIKSSTVGLHEFLLNLTGIEAGMQYIEKRIPETTSAFNLLRSTLFIGTAGLMAVIAAFGAYLIELEKARRFTDEFAKSQILNNGITGATTDSVVELTNSIKEQGATTSQAREALLAMSKVGGVVYEDIAETGYLAIQMNKYLGVSIEDVIKQYKDLSKEPSKNLVEIANKTGLVTEKIIEQVREYERLGETSEAVKLATEQLQEVHGMQVAAMHLQASGLKLIWLDVKTAISGAWDAMFGATGDPKKMQENLDRMKVSLNGILNVEGRDGPRAAEVKQLEKLIADGEKYLKIKTNPAEAEAEKARIKLGAEAARLREKSFTQEEQHLNEIARLKKLAEDPNASKEQITVFLKAKELEENKLKELRDKAKKGTKEVQDSAKGYYSMLEKFSDIEIQVAKARADGVEPLEMTTKAYAALQDMLNNDTWKNASNEEKKAILLKYEKVAALEIELLQYEKQKKSLEELSKVQEEFNKTSTSREVDIAKNNAELEFQFSILGKNTDEVRAMTLAYNEQSKIVAITAKYEATRLDVIQKYKRAMEGLNDPFEIEAANANLINTLSDLEKQQIEEVTNVRKEKNLEVAKDQVKAFEELRNSLSDVLYTALTEGGKSASKKIRDLIQEQLNKRFIMPAIDIVINATLNTVGLGGISGQGGQQGSSGSGGILNTASTLGSAYSNFTGGGMIGAALASPAAYGAALGTTSVGAGSQAAMLAAQTGSFGSAGLTATASAAGGASGGFMAAMGSALPWIGAGLGVLSIFGDDLFGGKEKYKAANLNMTGTVSSGLFSPTYTELKRVDPNAAEPMEKVLQAYSDKVSSLLGAFDVSTDNMRVGARIRQRRSSDVSLSSFGVSFTGEAGDDPWGWSNKMSGSYETEGNPLAAFEKFAADILTKGVKLAVEASSLPQAVKSIFEPLSDQEVDPAIAVIVSAAEGIKSLDTSLIDFLESGNLEEFRKGSEAAYLTLDRLVGTLVVTNSAFGDLGWALYEVSMQGADAASAFTELLGGLESSQAILSSYYENFYTEEEKRANTIKHVTKTLTDAGISITQSRIAEMTKEQYRELLEGTIAVEGASSAAAIALLKASAAFAELTVSAEAVTVNHKENIEKAYDALEKAVAADKAILDKRISDLTATESALSSIFKTISDAVNKLRNDSVELFAMSVSSANTIINSAISTGTLPESDVVSQSVSALVGNFGQSKFSNKVEEERARRLLIYQLDDLNDIAGEQLTEVQMQIKVAKDQLLALDNVLATAKQQVEAALGTTEAILSVKEAIDNLAAVLAQVSQNNLDQTIQNKPVVSDTIDSLYSNILGRAPDAEGAAYWESKLQSGVSVSEISNAISNSPEAQINSLYQSLLGRAPEAEGMSYWQGVMQSGASVSDVANAIKQSPEFLSKVGSYDVGANVIPNDQFAFIHKNEAIIPAAFNPWAGGTLPIDNSEMAEAITELRNEVQMLRYEARATATNTAKMSKQLDRASGENDVLKVQVVA